MDGAQGKPSVMPTHDWTYILSIAGTLVLVGVGIGVLWFGFLPTLTASLARNNNNLATSNNYFKLKLFIELGRAVSGSRWLAPHQPSQNTTARIEFGFFVLRRIGGQIRDTVL
jgi:hypothetical protein